MATADEFAAAAWNHGLVDPYDGSLKPAGTLLGWARHDAYRSFAQTVENSVKLDDLAAKVDALSAKIDDIATAAGIDPAELAQKIDAAIAAVVNRTTLHA